MESFLISYGLWALFLGMLIEGELLFITSIVLAKMGYFGFYHALVVVYFGAIGHDWIFYLIGRTQGSSLLKKRPHLKKNIIKLIEPFEKRPRLFFMTYRFLIGFRIVVLSIFGLKELPPQKFFPISLVANFLWVGTYGVLGYFFADIVIANLEWVKQYKLFIIAGIVLILYMISKRNG